jgi:hypothetical protein
MMGTSLRAMHSLEADKTAIRSETQIGVRPSQTRQGIKGYTIYAHENGGRETRLGVEFYPMDVVVV